MSMKSENSHLGMFLALRRRVGFWRAAAEPYSGSALRLSGKAFAAEAVLKVDMIFFDGGIGREISFWQRDEECAKIMKVNGRR
jgi:hypothetical protein